MTLSRGMHRLLRAVFALVLLLTPLTPGDCTTHHAPRLAAQTDPLAAAIHLCATAGQPILPEKSPGQHTPVSFQHGCCALCAPPAGSPALIPTADHAATLIWYRTKPHNWQPRAASRLSPRATYAARAPPIT